MRLLRALLVTAAVGCAHSHPPLHPDNPPGAWYVVQSGETLADIAGRAGVPVEDLREINGLGPRDVVEAGRLLFVLYGEDQIPVVVAEPEPGPPLAPAPQGTSPAALLRWPLLAPRLTSPFGTRQGRVHEGIDLGAPLGTPIHAAGAGRVLYAGNAVRGYGNMVVIEHPDGLLTVYAHNSVMLVRTGDRVGAGQLIARVGQSGRASAPHLHFEVRRGQAPHDPLRFLPPLSGGKP